MVVVSSFKQTCRYLQVNLLETMGCKQDKQTRPPKYVCCVYHLWGKYLPLCKQVIVGWAVMQLSCKNVWHDSDTILLGGFINTIGTYAVHVYGDFLYGQLVYAHLLFWLHDNIPRQQGSWANLGPIWGLQDPGGPHVGPMNFAIWIVSLDVRASVGTVMIKFVFR